MLEVYNWLHHGTHLGTTIRSISLESCTANLKKKTTMSTYNNQAAESMRHAQNVRRPSYGSSTGAPGFPIGPQDKRSQYDPATTGVNPSTGAPYQKPPPVASHSSNSYDQQGYNAPTQHASTAPQTNLNDRATTHTGSNAPGDKYAQKGEDIGRKAQGVMAGVHVSFFRYISGSPPPF